MDSQLVEQIFWIHLLSIKRTIDRSKAVKIAQNYIDFVSYGKTKGPNKTNDISAFIITNFNQNNYCWRSWSIFNISVKETQTSWSNCIRLFKSSFNKLNNAKLSVVRDLKITPQLLAIEKSWYRQRSKIEFVIDQVDGTTLHLRVKKMLNQH
jgi:hypothetical protein